VGSGTGQGGIAVDRMPVPERQIKPRYPMSARRMGQSGQVLLRLFVDAEGAVREVNVVRAEPPGVFENASVEAVRRWRFSPALARGAAVGMWMTLPVRFSLEDR
jgi:protein TonB